MTSCVKCEYFNKKEDCCQVWIDGGDSDVCVVDESAWNDACEIYGYDSPDNAWGCDYGM